MGAMKKKDESGAAVAFMSRGKALKKLQISLQDFRRLCILKGIYPHEPSHLKKAGKGSTLPVHYYFKKDIQFMIHDPIIQKMRDYKVFVRKLKKAADKKDRTKEKSLRKKRPELNLDHIIKQRYPTMVDALRDLDDALTNIFMYAKMPKNKKVHTEQITLCRRLSVEFLNYIIATRSLRKVFLTMKGFYMQASIQGETITWLMSHNAAYCHPTGVDYKIISAYTESFTSLLGFVNFALYKSIEVEYPPQIHINEMDGSTSYNTVTDVLSSFTRDLGGNPTNNIEDLDEEAQATEKHKAMFKGLKFFLNREVDREMFSFIIRSFGGEVSWCKSVLPVGVTYDAEDSCITHHVVDRVVRDQKIGRAYIHPQWVVDCVNARKLISTKNYEPGATLPSHMTPFARGDDADYNPPDDELSQEIITEEIESEQPNTNKEENEIEQPPKKKKKLPKESEIVSEGKVMKEYSQKEQEQKNEERKLQEMNIHKKNKRLYDKLKFINKKKTQTVKALKEKRKIHEKNLKNKEI